MTTCADDVMTIPDLPGSRALLLVFCRYLRMCHGSTSVATASSQATTVLMFDTAAYRAHAGITGSADLSAELTEWQAWLDGEVFGVVVQRRTPAVSCDHCGQSTPAA